MLFLAAVIAGGAYYFNNKEKEPVAPTLAGPKDTTSPFIITKEDIKEENFTGSVARISGDSQLAKRSEEYINQIFSEFKTQANMDVPDMRKQFGADSPGASYSIDISASRSESEGTESAVISVYTYTGGAHGSSSYKVFTALKASDKVLSLGDIVQTDKKEAFASYVKNKLEKWSPNGDAPVVFEEEVEGLTFESFSNWSLDEENLILYFSQYEIGPGVLGAVAFPLPLKDLKDLLK